MRVGNFSLLIPEGRERDSGHVEVPHGQVYTLRLANHWHDRDCDAEVSVDGKPLGGFRVTAGQTITLERTPDDSGRFTFFRADSAEGGQAGAGEVSTDLRGLVEVRFRAGWRRPPVRQPQGVRTMGMVGLLRSAGPQWSAGEREEKTSAGILYAAQADARDVSVQNCAAGVTGLTGHSAQEFTDVPALAYDSSEEVVIALRLVAGPTVRKLEPTRLRHNPVPAPVE